MGLAGMAEGAREQLTPPEDYRPEVDEFRELDEERVRVLYRRRGAARRAG